MTEREGIGIAYISKTAGPGFISSNSIKDQHFVLTYSPLGFQCLNSNSIADPTRKMRGDMIEKGAEFTWRQLVYICLYFYITRKINIVFFFLIRTRRVLGCLQHLAITIYNVMSARVQL